MAKKVALELINARFGMLTVLSRGENNKFNQSYWICKCDCGNVKQIAGNSLVRNKTVSCGCYNKSKAGKSSFKHGHSRRKNKTAEYRCYRNMLNRCLDEKNNHYHSYGGRGIKVCSRWLDSFENFFEDMGKRPSPKHSIDRIDVNGHYEPLNCKWATSFEQARNRTNNVWHEHNGVKMITADWAKFFQVNPETIRMHLNKGKPFHKIYDLYVNKERSGKWKRYHENKNK